MCRTHPRLIITIAAIGLSTSAMCQVSLDLVTLGKVFGGWTHKGNTAAEFKSSDHKYRLYKPTYSRAPNRVMLVSAKINHIRTLQYDDLCHLDMDFDNAGQLIGCRSFLKVRKKEWRAQVTAADVGGAGLSSVELASRIVQAIYSKMPTKFPPGNGEGTDLFPRVIRHCMNQIVDNVLVAGRRIRFRGRGGG